MDTPDAENIDIWSVTFGRSTGEHLFLAKGKEFIDLCGEGGREGGRGQHVYARSQKEKAGPGGAAPDREYTRVLVRSEPPRDAHAHVRRRRPGRRDEKTPP